MSLFRLVWSISCWAAHCFSLVCPSVALAVTHRSHSLCEQICTCSFYDDVMRSFAADLYDQDAPSLQVKVLRYVSPSRHHCSIFLIANCINLWCQAALRYRRPSEVYLLRSAMSGVHMYFEMCVNWFARVSNCQRYSCWGTAAVGVQQLLILLTHSSTFCPSPGHQNSERDNILWIVMVLQHCPSRVISFFSVQLQGLLYLLAAYPCLGTAVLNYCMLLCPCSWRSKQTPAWAFSYSSTEITGRCFVR